MQVRYTTIKAGQWFHGIGLFDGSDNDFRKKYPYVQVLCRGCNQLFDLKDMEVDHIIPKSKYSQEFGSLIGMNDENNLQLLCGSCNRAKSDQLIPIVPRTIPSVSGTDDKKTTSLFENIFGGFPKNPFDSNS